MTCPFFAGLLTSASEQQSDASSFHLETRRDRKAVCGLLVVEYFKSRCVGRPDSSIRLFERPTAGGARLTVGRSLSFQDALHVVDPQFTNP